MSEEFDVAHKNAADGMDNLGYTTASVRNENKYRPSAVLTSESKSGKSRLSARRAIGWKPVVKWSLQSTVLRMIRATHHGQHCTGRLFFSDIRDFHLFAHHPCRLTLFQLPH